VTGKEKERDWDREMAEVDKLLAKLPEADPTLGRGAPPLSKTARLPGAAPHGSAAGSPSALATWFRLGLGLLLGVGMLVWPYSHVCGFKLMFYGLGVGIVTVVGASSALSSWKRRLGLAHVLSLALLAWGVALTAGIVLPRIGYAGQHGLWFCPEPPVQITPNR
jgi:hypothetical protein